MIKKMYGTAGDTYRMTQGQGYKFKDHILICGDLQQQAWYERVWGYAGMADMMYTDLPYNQAMHTSYFNKAGLKRGAPIEDLIAKVISLSFQIQGFVFIETGVGMSDFIKGEVKNSGAIRIKEWDITYYKKNPAKLIGFTFIKNPFMLDRLDFTGMDDAHTPLYAIESLRPEIIMDPCAGRGTTPLAAQQAGIRSISNELSDRRLAVAVERLVKAGAGKPKKMVRNAI